MHKRLQILKENLAGTLHWDQLYKNMYATDASVYRNLPTAVAYPKTAQDVQKLVHFANDNKIGLTARGAGTSLAGQCVSEGIVVDFSKHFTKIEEIDLTNRRVRIQPGVIRDELNRVLAPDKLFFGPNTSTSNRCMLGGMLGNNSSGTTSIRYGVTRDKVLGVQMVLLDGSLVEIKEQTPESFHQTRQRDDSLGKIYQALYALLNAEGVKAVVQEAFPKKEIHRRNTGYALDALLEMQPFGDEKPFNLAKLIAGSEGTLGLVTSITVALDPLPPKEKVMVAAQYKSIADCLDDVAPLMLHKLYSCELMDKKVLDCTLNNIKYSKYRHFIKGDPAAVLLLELCADTKQDLERQLNDLLDALDSQGKAYSRPALRGQAIDDAMELRKAGLGLLGNMIGDAKAVACIEDTAVATADLSSYISEFTALMKEFGQDMVYYAHAGAGELHLRPILNLKEAKDVAAFKNITTAVARLVKKYRGSLSGEHGDGIVRGSLLPQMLGETVYGYLRELKAIFDPKMIFNPGKIIDAWPMDERLRYESGAQDPDIKTFLDFSESIDILRAAEQCNGSGDCRKLPAAGGTLCPSYHATRNEKDTTRARANVLREILTNSKSANPFNDSQLKEVMDLCIGCKACSSECPSNVNVAKFKAEFLFQYKKENGSKRSDNLFAKSEAKTALLAKFPRFSNVFLLQGPIGSLIKNISGVAPKRSLPRLSTLKFDFDKAVNVKNGLSSVTLMIDEFSRYYDKQIAQDAFDLLVGLGYKVSVNKDFCSARALLSKGFLEEAKMQIDQNIDQLKKTVNPNRVIVGLEPSAILGFRDEYTYMATDTEAAKEIATETFMIEEFLAAEITKGNIRSDQFTTNALNIKIHNHCYQKALSDQKCTFDILNLPVNYKPTIIPSGCCGMAGSFGYEKEHYQVSMTIGQQTLFPAVQKAPGTVLIAANGTSCRHQILDGTGKSALHPVSILKQALA